MADGRWLEIWRIFSGLFVIFALISCSGRQVTTTAVSLPTPTKTPFATLTSQPTYTKDTFPPKETPDFITPVAFDAKMQNLIQVIDSTYHFPLACKLDWLNPSKNPPPYNATPDPKWPPRKLEFVDITYQVELDKVWIRQIVDSADKNHRAYLVEEPVLEKCANCIRSAIYIENEQDKHIYRIDFQGYQPNRVLYGLGWVGNQIVTFAQNDSPYYDDLFGINVETKNYVYVASFPRCSN